MALGVEAAGEIVAIGPGVEWPAIGAAVMTHPLPLRHQGCWAERLVAPAALVAEKPDNVTWAEAAGFPGPPLPAWQVGAQGGDPLPRATILVKCDRGGSRRG